MRRRALRKTKRNSLQTTAEPKVVIREQGSRNSKKGAMDGGFARKKSQVHGAGYSLTCLNQGGCDICFVDQCSHVGIELGELGGADCSRHSSSRPGGFH